MEEKSDKIFLKSWQIGYAKDLANALNNRKIIERLRDGLPFPYTQKDAEEFIASMLQADPNAVFAYAIVVNNVCAGSIAAFRQSNIHFRTAELGYYLAEEFWGRGIMTVAVKEICDRIYASTDILRIYAEPFSDNPASRRVLEKADFEYEGTLRCNAVKNGKVKDMALYSRIKS